MSHYTVSALINLIVHAAASDSSNVTLCRICIGAMSAFHHIFVTSDVLHSMSEPVTQYHQHTIDTHKTAELIYIENQLFVIYL